MTNAAVPGVLTLGCSRHGPLRLCHLNCDIIASRTTRLNPGPLDGPKPSLAIRRRIHVRAIAAVVIFGFLSAGCAEHQSVEAAR